MNADVLIGVDAGTSVIKAVAFDLSGHQISIASRPNSYATLANGGVEQNMARTWTDTVEVLAEVVEAVGAERVLTLGITGQGDGTWMIDAHGEPVHDGWLWLDARATQEARELTDSANIDAIHQVTGCGVTVCQMRTHMHWMQRHTPEILDRAATAFHCKDWLYFKLTGIRATDPTEGVFTFGDFRTRQYSDQALEALELSHLSHLLPPIVDGSTQTHQLTAEAAEKIGLPQGLPVSLGYVDIMCCALGAGLHDAATMPGLTILGSTGVHMRFVPDEELVVMNEELSGYVMGFPGKALAQMQTNMAATLNIDWLLGLGAELLSAHGQKTDPSELLKGLDEQVLDARAGAVLFHPYISSAGERGPFINSAARASFTGLDQQASWFDLVRSVFEGLALASRDCYALMGPMPKEIRFTGGAAKSKALRQILAACLNTPIRGVAQVEAGAAGAVMIAGIAQGIFSDAEAATDAWVQPLLEDPIPPDAELASTYGEVFEAYLATRHALAPAWQAQATMRSALA
ncbi:MAG: FGGY-family carbohydrate kinase [Pseudomonadota bacterium]